MSVFFSLKRHFIHSFIAHSSAKGTSYRSNMKFICVLEHGQQVKGCGQQEVGWVFHFLILQHSWLLKVVFQVSPKSTQENRQQEYYPLWKYVTKVKQMGSSGMWKWKCNLCKNVKTFKGSYTRVKAHILNEEIKGINVCAHTKNP